MSQQINLGRGIGRTPRDRVRTRRALQRTGNIEIGLGNGLSVDPDGDVIVTTAPPLTILGGDVTLNLADNSLEVVGGGLAVKLKPDGGLGVDADGLFVEEGAGAELPVALLTNEEEDDYLFGVPAWEFGEDTPCCEILVEDS